MKSSTHELLNQQHQNPLYKNHPHFSLFGVLNEEVQAMKFQSQVSYKTGSFMRISAAIVIHNA